MKITQVSGPHAVAATYTNEAARTAKAVAAFQRGASSYDKAPSNIPSQEVSGQSPVRSQNSVQPEEMGAIIPKPQIQHNESENQIQRGVEQAAKGEFVESPLTHQEVQGEAQEVTQPPTPQAPKDPTLSRQFAQLANKERQLRQAQQQVKAREQALAEREQALTRTPQPTTPAIDRSQYVAVEDLKRNAYDVLQQHGVSYDDVTAQAMQYQPINPEVQRHIQTLEAKLSKLEEATQTQTKTWQEQQTQQYQAAVKQIDLDIAALVKSDPVTYEAIAKSGRQAQLEVRKLIEETYKQDGILMTVEEAAEEVENYILDEGFKTFSQIEKFKKRMAPVPATAKQAPVQTQSNKQTPPMKTLTNATSSPRKLSAKERAMLAFKGELKS